MSNKVVWHDEFARHKAKIGAQAGLIASGEALLASANEKAPLMLGTLIGTGAVSLGVEQLAETAVVSYDTVYAARLHEHPEYDFQNGREGKWLERAADEDHEAGELIGRALKGALR